MLPSRAHQGDAIDSVRLPTTDKVSGIRTRTPQEQRSTSRLVDFDTSSRRHDVPLAPNMEAQTLHRSPTVALAGRYSLLGTTKKIPILYSTHQKSTEPVSAKHQISSTSQHHNILKNQRALPTNPPFVNTSLPINQSTHPTTLGKPKQRPTQQCPTTQCQEPMTKPSTQTSCATETLSQQHQHLLLPLLLPTAPRATQSNLYQTMNGAGVLCAGEPNSAWCSDGV